MLEINSLLELAKNGNENAINKIIKMYEPLIYSVINTLNFYNSIEIEELIQEGRFSIYKTIKTFDETKNCSFPTFAKVIIRRSLINYSKSASTNNAVCLNNHLELNNQSEIEITKNGSTNLIPVGANYNTPETDLLNLEDINTLLKEVNSKLSAFEKELVSLSYLGYSYSEMAKMLQKTTKSIDNGLSRIKSKSKNIKR